MIIQTKYLKGSGIANWVSKLYLRKVISLNRFHSTLFDQKKTGCNDWCGRRSYIADVVMEYMFCLQGIPCQGNYQWGKMNTKLGRGLLNNVVLYLIQQHLTKAARAEKWRGKNQTHHTWQTYWDFVFCLFCFLHNLHIWSFNIFCWAEWRVKLPTKQISLLLCCKKSEEISYGDGSMSKK